MTGRDNAVPSHLTSQGSGLGIYCDAYTAAFYSIPGQPRFFLTEYASTARRGELLWPEKSFRAQCMLQCFIYIRFDTCLGFVLLGAVTAKYLLGLLKVRTNSLGRERL